MSFTLRLATKLREDVLAFLITESTQDHDDDAVNIISHLVLDAGLSEPILVHTGKTPVDG
jgi:hypothetical protein